jgi:UMF1 family MFS transporter
MEGVQNTAARAVLDREEVGRWSWALYDWANSPFTTIVITFIFPAYFQAVMHDAAAGQTAWGYAISASALVIAVLAPLLGAVADAYGGRKPWIFAFTTLCILGSSSLWFVEPSTSLVLFGLICVGVANVGFEFGVIFNNAMLPDIVPKERLGRLSGWAWGLGYAGGLVSLVAALLVFIWPQSPPFGLNAASAEHIRIIGPLVALWFAVFSVPLFLFTPDRPASGISPRQAVTRALRDARQMITRLPRNANVSWFLLAHMIYADGLVTLFAFGGIFAAGVFGLTLAEVITFGIVLNVAAGIGAFAFAWVDDWLGSKQTIIVALTGLIIASAAAVAATNRVWLWTAGIGIGLFVGPAQAASRSLMARLTKPERQAFDFGLFALSGKATAFVGPLVVAVATDISGSQRIGLASTIGFFLLGLIFLLRVTEEGRAQVSAT